MPPRAQRSLSFVDRHELWSGEQRRAGAAVEREIKRRKLEVVRFAFCDQHGVLRGKTLVASEAAAPVTVSADAVQTIHFERPIANGASSRMAQGYSAGPDAAPI